jgi:hypothetical protein
VLIDILKVTSHENIRARALVLMFYISQTRATKRYLLSQNIISVLTDKKFISDHIFVGQLVTDLLNIPGFRITVKLIDELLKLFEMYK